MSPLLVMVTLAPVALAHVAVVTSAHAQAPAADAPTPVEDAREPAADAPTPAEDAQEPAAELPADAPTPAELAARTEARIQALEERADRVEVLEHRLETLHDKMVTLAPLARFLTVFIDVGWFTVGGDGSGVRRDVGHRYVADHDHVPADWVLIGDPLSTTINSLGEPADLGAARAITDDTIDSNGHPTFILNTVGLGISRSITERIAIGGLVELLPRPGPDRVVVELAHIDYRPSNELDLMISAGKIDSVLGIEYRAQDAPRRLGVTPSLLCRYICGRNVGVQGRLHARRFDLSASLTNGDSFEERFEPDPRLASSKLPTLAVHIQRMLPIADGLELGVSAALGPQDGQAALHVHQWHYGFDLSARAGHGLELQAEFVQGKQQGSSTGLAHAAEAMPDSSIIAPRCSVAACLRYKAAYGLASWRARPWFVPYVRVDWRDARHQHGVDFLYVSRVLRGTVGLRTQLTSRIIGKLEYTRNHELLGPQFPNDVVTSSVVISTE